MLDRPRDLALMFRAKAAAALRHNFHSHRHESAQKLSVPKIRTLKIVDAKVTSFILLLIDHWI